MKPKTYESRTIPGSVEIREREGGGAILRGLAAVFDKLSDNLGGFREIIAPGAFDGTDMSDVRGLFNHDANFVLGRSKSETLRLKRTKAGLEYEIDLPDTQSVRDLVLEPIKRGDVDQSSFGFIVGSGNDSWAENDDGVLIRTIHAVRTLFDVSPVTFPAYPDTTVGARSMQAYMEQRENDALAMAQQIAENKHRAKFLEKIEREQQMPGG